MLNNLLFLLFLLCWNALKIVAITVEPKSYTAMLLYLFFDSLLSTCLKKMETEKWPKAADSPLSDLFIVNRNYNLGSRIMYRYIIRDFFRKLLFILFFFYFFRRPFFSSPFFPSACFLFVQYFSKKWKTKKIKWNSIREKQKAIKNFWVLDSELILFNQFLWQFI